MGGGGAGQGGGRPGEKGAGGGIPKVAGSGRKREKLCNIAQYFAIQKNAKGREPKNTGREPGLKGTGSGRFKPPCPPPPEWWRPCQDSFGSIVLSWKQNNLLKCEIE